MGFEKQMTDRIIRELGAVFHHADKRVRVLADVDKYKWKEEESVWNQAKGITSKEYESYFDGEFIVFMTESDGEEKNWLKFVEKFKELYKDGKIYVHEEMYEVKDAAAKKIAEESKVDVIPEAYTPEEKMVADVLIRHSKKKGRKVKRSK